MDSWTEMQSYVGFDVQDRQNLRQAWPVIQPAAAGVVERFYQVVSAHPQAAIVLQSPEQIQRLMVTMGVWMEELFVGPWDQAYFERRQQIGRVHVRVGLPDRYMITAMSRMRHELSGLLFESLEWRVARELSLSVCKICDLDLAAMMATYVEVHEQNRLRTLQDLIIQNMPVTVLCLDGSGRVNSATAPGARLLLPQAKIGQPLDAFLPSELWEVSDLDAALVRAGMTGRVVTIPRAQLVQEGVERHFRITLVPLQHELAHMLVHLEELTDVVDAEVRAQQAESLARIGTLAANIAHEIRNPLAAISATLQVIGGSLAQDDRRKVVLEKVQAQVLRLNRLVSDLLGYARPAIAQTQAMTLTVLVGEAIRQSGVQAQVSGQGEQRVFADPHSTRQALVNLLQNAGEVAQRVWVVLGPGPSVRVCDDGPGIEQERRQEIFEPFVTTKAKGTGLGLAISRKYIEAVGGHLELEPSEQGAVFLLSLQVAPSE